MALPISTTNRIPLLSSSLGNLDSGTSTPSTPAALPHANRRARRSSAASTRKGKARIELDVFPDASPPTPDTNKFEFLSSSEDLDIDVIGNFLKDLIAKRNAKREKETNSEYSNFNYALLLLIVST